MTQYANALVDGAKAYAAHPVRYDLLGENGFNSNSFISSLIVAKGGATGLADVQRIASIVDTSPVRTAGEPSTMNDSQVAELVQRDLHQGRIAAPGFGHAAIEPEQFTHREIASAPRRGAGVQDFFAAIPALVAESTELGRAGSDLSVRGSVAPFLPGGAMHIRYDGRDREVGTGYRQTGTILKVEDGIVTQHIGQGKTTEYQMTDLISDARDPEAMEGMIVPGRYIQVSIVSDRVHVTSLERNQDVTRAQQHGFERGGR